jgi:hypothetical protein
MLDKNAFANLNLDFVESQDFIEIAHSRRRSMNFVCHHNSYLVAGFLRRRGHVGIEWISGHYRCHEPAKRIHHSWLTLTIDGNTAAIFEFDPRQLYKRGGYENDPMPSGYFPEFAITISPIASIVDPGMVDLPDESRDAQWIVQSKAVLMRYVEDEALVPDINFADLDTLGLEVQEEFDEYKKFLEESDSD